MKTQFAETQEDRNDYYDASKLVDQKQFDSIEEAREWLRVQKALKNNDGKKGLLERWISPFTKRGRLDKMQAEIEEEEIRAHELQGEYDRKMAILDRLEKGLIHARSRRDNLCERMSQLEEVGSEWFTSSHGSHCFTALESLHKNLFMVDVVFPKLEERMLNEIAAAKAELTKFEKENPVLK